MPEELNRIVVDRLSTLLFAPPTSRRRTSRREGIIDGVHRWETSCSTPTCAWRPSPANARRRWRSSGSIPAATPSQRCTARRTSASPRSATSSERLNALDQPVVFPLHPRTTAAIEEQGHRLGGQVRPRPPLGYLDFAALASQARVDPDGLWRPPKGGLLVRGAVHHAQAEHRVGRDGRDGLEPARRAPTRQRSSPPCRESRAPARASAPLWRRPRCRFNR